MNANSRRCLSGVLSLAIGAGLAGCFSYSLPHGNSLKLPMGDLSSNVGRGPYVVCMTGVDLAEFSARLSLQQVSPRAIVDVTVTGP